MAAITSHSYLSTLDITSGTAVQDYSSYFYRKPLDGGEAKFWNLISKRQDAQGDTITWFEDADIPTTITAINTADGDLTASADDTNLVVASGEGASRFIRVGQMFRDTTSDGREIIKVTAITGDSLTIQRGVGNSSPEVHTRAAVWALQGTLQFQGSEQGTPVGANRVARTNTMSILDENIKLTRSQLRQIMHAVSDNWVWTNERALRHYERQWERHLIWSAGVSRSNTDSAEEQGSMKGLIDLIDQYGSATMTNSTFGTFTYGKWDNVMKLFEDKGYDSGTDLVMLVPSIGKQAAAYIHESALRGNYASETTRGLTADHLLSTFGHLIPIIPVANIGNRFLIFPLEKVALRFVDTLLVYDTILGQGGNDYAMRRWISEGTLEAHDCADCFYMAEDVTFVVPED
jgi:hypothetical protein